MSPWENWRRRGTIKGGGLAASSSAGLSARDWRATLQNRRTHTNPKRKRGNELRLSLACASGWYAGAVRKAPGRKRQKTAVVARSGRGRVLSQAAARDLFPWRLD